MRTALRFIAPVFFSILIYACLVTAIHAEAKESQKWRCLRAVQKAREGNGNPPTGARIAVASYGKIPRNADVYIVSCIGGGKICSTGSVDLDNVLFNTDMTPKIPADISVSPNNPTHPNGDGYITGAEVTFTNNESKAYKFYAVTIGEEGKKPTAAPSASPTVAGSPAPTSTLELGQKQITFAFDTPTPSISPPSPTQAPDEQGSCASILWDPYGRMFDSQSLEPLPDMRVRLLGSDKKAVKRAGVINPSPLTHADGLFNFLVPPGTYFLQPVLKSGYSFSATPTINQNYSLAYSDIYKPDEAIVEKAGVPEHRDIPLDPGSNTPYQALFATTVEPPASVRLGTQIEYTGTVSHPLSTVYLTTLSCELFRDQSYPEEKAIAKTEADTFGHWNLLVDDVLVPADTALFACPKKRILTAQPLSFLMEIINKIINPVSAQTSASSSASERIEPILASIEGYAYDAKKNVLPYATVDLRLSMSDEKYFTTQTDDKGFFYIDGKNIPSLPYYLVFLSSDGNISVRQTLSQFAKKNEVYLKEKALNLATQTATDSPPPPARNRFASVAPTAKPPEINRPTRNGGQIFMILITLVLLILSVVGIIFFWIKKRPTTTNYE